MPDIGVPPSVRNADPFDTWRSAFWARIQDGSTREILKSAALEENLRTWTNELTTVVVQSCEATGWTAAAKWNPCRRLPKAGQEFLGMDVTAFPAEFASKSPAVKWPAPIAVFELENSKKNDRVAYSLWKVLLVRADLRVVFAYRPDRESGKALVEALQTDVIESLTAQQRQCTLGTTILVIGNRGKGETFPYGYFKFWILDMNRATFDRA